MPALFALGQTVATPAALAVLTNNTLSPAVLLDRHISGDWGDVDEHDKAVNDASVEGGRILSVYRVPSGDTLWCITEWDRSATTLLLPSEY